MAMRAGATSSSSAAICAIAVTAPWPSSTLPEKTSTEPGGSKRTQRSRRGLSRRSTGSTADGLQDAYVRAAAAKVAVQRRLDLFFAGGIILQEKSKSGDHDPVDAVAALRSLLVEESLAQQIELLRFDGRDVAAGR